MEKQAILAFQMVNSSVKVDMCGLVIHTEHSRFAATPDGIVQFADSRKLAVGEVKCSLGKKAIMQRGSIEHGQIIYESSNRRMKQLMDWLSNPH